MGFQTYDITIFTKILLIVVYNYTYFGITKVLINEILLYSKFTFTVIGQFSGSFSWTMQSSPLGILNNFVLS